MKHCLCERTVYHRPRDPRAATSEAVEVLWCKTHDQEMLTGLRCATGWDEEISELRTEIAGIKLRMDRAHR